jgi:transcriptional regulator with XRE-family HTH domain
MKKQIKARDFFTIAREKLSAEDIAASEQWVAEELERLEIQEAELKQLRKALKLSQEQVAHAAKMTQSDLSKAERRGDMRLSTLRRYVEALGGKFVVGARFGDKLVWLRTPEAELPASKLARPQAGRRVLASAPQARRGRARTSSTEK